MLFFATKLWTLLGQLIAQLTIMSGSLKSIATSLNELAYPTPNGISLSMASLPESKPMKLVILDDGKGIQFTAQPTKNGNPVNLKQGQVPVWTILDSTGAPADPNPLVTTLDSTGLVLTGTIPDPVVDGTGYTAKIELDLTPGGGTDIVDQSDSFDIAPDPENVDNFTIQSAAL